MKLRLSTPQKKLRATAARRAAPSRAMEEEEEEPTMKLSKALVIVLLLHVVFILGVYSFSSINAHRSHTAVPVANVQPPPPPPIPPVENPASTAPTSPAVAPAATTGNLTKAADDSSSKKLPAATATATPKDSGKLYTVVKGEAPERIAKKLGVSYNDLMKLNHIDDAKRLQIGQVLHVPMKRTPTS